MTPTPTPPPADAPRLYDLLDVAPDATAEHIRAAWKSAIADLDPSDRRFRAYNQAAELLLDPERRAAYDARLAEEDEAAVEAEPPSVVSTRSTNGGTSSPPLVEEVAQQPSRNHGEPTRDGRPVPGWLLVGLAVLTAAAIGLAAWLYVGVPSDDAVEGSTRAAQAAAERAVVPVLSYDAATLDEDQLAASEYLTTSYRQEYEQLFELIRDNAPQLGTKVDVEVITSGVVRSGDDRVQVLVFVNRPTTNKQQSEPVVYRDQVTLTMEKVGDSWLIDDLVTSPPAE